MKIVGICIVGENEKFFSHTKKCLDELCDEVVYWKDKREWGKFQPQIKEDALRCAIAKNPDWILTLDADEELITTRERLEAIANEGEVSRRFYFLQKWNSEDRMNEKLNFFDVRFYKWIPELGVSFHQYPVHCGMAPKWAYNYAWDAPLVVLHRGLMLKEDRERKVKRYEKYDPKQTFCSPFYYGMLKSDFAGDIYDINDVQRKVEQMVAMNGTRKPPEIKNLKINMPKLYRVLRLADNEELVIEEKALEDTLNTGGRGKLFKLLGETEAPVEKMAEAPVVIVEPFTCPTCNFVAKSAFGLSVHQRTHKNQ